MKLKNLIVYVLIVCFAFAFAGCGSKPSKDDDDVRERMDNLVDTKYYTLSEILDIQPVEDDEDEQSVTYGRTKFITHYKDFTLISKGESEKCYAYMEVQNFEETEIESKGISYKTLVAYNDGTISWVETDKDIADPNYNEFNVLNEEILCLPVLQSGMNWVSDNGYYSEVVRYEYVVITRQGRAAASFQIATYTDETKTQLVRKVWWTPAIGWCCQWQDYSSGELDKYMILTDLDYDWEDDEI